VGTWHVAAREMNSKTKITFLIFLYNPSLLFSKFEFFCELIRHNTAFAYWWKE